MASTGPCGRKCQSDIKKIVKNHTKKVKDICPGKMINNNILFSDALFLGGYQEKSENG